jgi:uncharacterized protein YfcZ (UPF0381/DUF406 family)
MRPSDCVAALDSANGENAQRDEDMHTAIERARQAQEREPVRLVIEPADAEAERALLAEFEQAVADGTLVEVGRR